MALGTKSKDIVYGYSVGRVRALEGTAVDRTRFSRLIDSMGLDDMHMVLAETVYGSATTYADTIDEIEEAISSRLGSIYGLCDEGDIPKELGIFFRCRHDFNNLRALIKSGYGQELDVRLSRLGTVPPEKAEAISRVKGYGGLPDYLGKVSAAAAEAYEESGDFEQIDTELDRGYFALLRNLVPALRSPWIDGYLRLLIDIANGRTAVRIKTGGEKMHYFFEPGGNIEPDSWKAWLKGIETDIRTEVLGGDWGPAGDDRAWADAVKTIALADSPIIDYESEVDTLRMRYIKTSRLFACGPEPILAFITAIEQEVKLVRTIIFSRINGIEPSIIRKQLGAAL